MLVLLTYFHNTLSLVEESLLFVHINGALKVYPIFLSWSCILKLKS